jgi:hypothetical protein
MWLGWFAFDHLCGAAKQLQDSCISAGERVTFSLFFFALPAETG